MVPTLYPTFARSSECYLDSGTCIVLCSSEASFTLTFYVPISISWEGVLASLGEGSYDRSYLLASLRCEFE